MVLSETVVERPLSLSLSDPIPELVEHLCLHLVCDGHSLLRLGAVNKFWHGVLSDPELWQRLVATRFGPGAAPSACTPAKPATAIPGWCFFPGLDSGGFDCAKPEDANGSLNPCDLAARAERMEAIAFNTQGWIKTELLPTFRWNRYSYVPGVGLYVKEEAVTRALGAPLPIPLPEKAEPQVRPPDLPGWVLYHKMNSEGGDIRHPATGDDNFTSTCTTLEELAEVASRLQSCVAFNTEGYLKEHVKPQVHWQHDYGGSCSWAGLYVREDVVEARRLRRAQAGSRSDPCLRYFQMEKTRLQAASDVVVTWLNSTYLTRVPDRAPAPQATTAAAGTVPAAAVDWPGTNSTSSMPAAAEVVKLNHVCWLELNGKFNGVGPGRYLCKWSLNVAGDCNVDQLNFRICLQAARSLGSGLAASTEVPAGTAAPGFAAGGSSDGSGEGLGIPSPELDRSAVIGEQLLSHASSGWYEQPAGSFEVPTGAVYDVEVVLWNHDATWKRGLMFKELVLYRLDEETDARV